MSHYYYVVPNTLAPCPPMPSSPDRDPHDPQYVAVFGEICQGATGDACKGTCGSVHERGSMIFYHGRGYLCEACYRGRPLLDLSPYPAFATRVEAFAACDVHTSEILFHLPASVDQVWRTRERDRFHHHAYLPVPWDAPTPTLTAHYAHMSVDKPALIAFTRDPEAGHLDKQTRMKPGRYLQTFYAEHFSAEEIALYVATCAAYATGEFSLATTPEDITRIYNVTTGPDSCMRRKEETEYDWQTLLDDDKLPCHPCAVYAGPDTDLAVAYVGPLDNISQRAVVWPAKQTYVRVYGTGPLESLLHTAGYRSVSNHDTARLRAVPYRDGYVTPYVDGSSRGYIADGMLILGSTSNRQTRVPLDNTCGHSVTESRPCRACGEGDADDDSGLCSSCEDARWVCEACDHESFSDADQYSCHDSLFCESCYDNRIFSCDECQEDFDTEAFSARAQASRERRHVEGFCGTCETLFTWCECCHSLYRTDDHETCPNNHTEGQTELPLDAPVVNADECWYFYSGTFVCAWYWSGTALYRWHRTIGFISVTEGPYAYTPEAVAAIRTRTPILAPTTARPEVPCATL